MIAHVVAIAKNNCIGNHGKLPWSLPKDMKHFKDITVGHIVLMGRKTWESIPEKFRPLPDRTNVVITRQTGYPVPESVEVYGSINDALGAHVNSDIMIIGGGEIFRETLELTDTLYVTHVNQYVDGDAFYPPINPKHWKETEREDHEGFSFITYVRNTKTTKLRNG